MGLFSIMPDFSSLCVWASGSTDIVFFHLGTPRACTGIQTGLSACTKHLIDASEIISSKASFTKNRKLSIFFSVYACSCVRSFTLMCAHVRGVQGTTLGAILHSFSGFCFEMGAFHWHRAYGAREAVWPADPRNLLISAFPTLEL